MKSFLPEVETSHSSAVTSNAMRTAQAAKNDRQGGKNRCAISARVSKPPKVSIPTRDRLQPDWSIRSYPSSWTEHGLVASVELIPIQDQPVLGYTLETSLDLERFPGGRISDRQQEIGDQLIAQLRTRMVEALQQAGWRVVRRPPGKKEVWQHASQFPEVPPASRPMMPESVLSPTPPPMPVPFLLAALPEPEESQPDVLLVPGEESTVASGARTDQQRPDEGKIYAVYGSKQAREQAKQSGAPPAFTRHVSKRLVTFQCAICGNQVTEAHLPGQKPRYCMNETCQREAVRIRVQRSREKKKARQAQR